MHCAITYQLLAIDAAWKAMSADIIAHCSIFNFNCHVATLWNSIFRFTQSISASIKDTTVNGVEGLNINWEAPFKFDDYVVGFRYALGNLKKAPESLFAKRTYDTPIVEGAATVDVDYNLDSKVFAVESKWVGKGESSTSYKNFVQ